MLMEFEAEVQRRRRSASVSPSENVGWNCCLRHNSQHGEEEELFLLTLCPSASFTSSELSELDYLRIGSNRQGCKGSLSHLVWANQECQSAGRVAA